MSSSTDSGFRCIIADPPWQYQQKHGEHGADAQYTTMSFEAICQLRDGGNLMGQRIAENAHLWLWITNPFLVNGYGTFLCDRWGFSPKTIATWVKGRFELAQPVKLVHHIGQGHYLRNDTEHCIFAVRGSLPPLVRNLPTSFIYPGRWPDRLHSEKPPVIHEWAEQLSPGPRLELFARRQREGWTCIGDQIAVP